MMRTLKLIIHYAVYAHNECNKYLLPIYRTDYFTAIMNWGCRDFGLKC